MKNISNFNKRKQRVRSSIRKKSSLPRLSIFISNKNIYAFVIDNLKNDTVCSTSTKSLKISGSNIDSATKVGEKIAQEAIKKKMIKDDNKFNAKLEASTDIFTCPRTTCKSKKCTYYELQTRSADEPMTIFVTCLDCGKNFKKS